MSRRDNCVTLYKDEKVELLLEPIDGLPYLHCYIDEWSKKDYVTFLHQWVEIQDTLKSQGIDLLFTWSPNEKSAKFARMFGFKTLVTDEAGQSLSFMRY